MKKISLIATLLALSYQGYSQGGIRADGAVRIVTSGNVNIVTDGNIQVNAGAALTAAATSVIKLTGAAQNLNFGASTTLGNLQVGGNNTKTLQQNVAIATNLDFSGGAKLAIGANNLTVNGVTNASQINGYVVTNGTGNVVQTFQAGDIKDFPIGDATNYTPLILAMNSATGTGTVGVNVVGGSRFASADASNYLNRYWNIAVSGLTGVQGDLSGVYATGELVGGVNVKPVYYGTSACGDFGATNITTSPTTTVTVNPFATNGVFTGSAQGTTVFVRTDGNDTNCGFVNTSAGAKLTLQAALSAIAEGGTVVLNAGTYNETATLTGKSITFQGVGNPTVQTVVMNGAGKTLTLSGNVNISEMVNVQAGDLATGGNLTLLATATKQAMLIQSATTNVNGNVNVQRYLRANAGTASLGYRFVSSPTSNATFAQLSELSPIVNADFNTSTRPGLTRPFPTLYTYDATRAGDPSKTFTSSPSPDFDKGWTSPAALTENMGIGRGYTVNTSANQVAEITGTVNNGNVSVPIVTGNVASSGYNLVGNPYPSPISWATVLAASTGVNNAIYQNMATGQYTGSWASFIAGVGTNGATDDIAVMQGFFVIANAGGSVNFTNAARATSYKNPSSFRTEDDKNASKNQGLLRLAMTNTAGKTDETVVYFADKATQNFDSQYDAVKFQLNAGNFPNIYTTDNKTLFSINALPQLNDDLIIPITVQSWTEGVQKIAMTEKLNFTREVQVFLKDKSNGKLHDLSKGGFEFSMSAGVLADRFELIFKPQFTQSELNGDILSVYPNPTADKISISLGDDYKGTLTLRLTDVSGREIWVEKTEKSGKIYQTSTSLENLASGTYFLEVEGSKKVVKKIVKN